LLQEDSIRPQDIFIGEGDGDALQKAQKLIYKYGELLYWWQEIADAAKKLRKQHCRLATAI
jgi:hypothetical protein